MVVRFAQKGKVYLTFGRSAAKSSKVTPKKFRAPSARVETSKVCTKNVWSTIPFDARLTKVVRFTFETCFKVVR